MRVSFGGRALPDRSGLAFWRLSGREQGHTIDPLYTGRATVPVLWDKKRQIIVNNESADIVRMLNNSFGQFSKNGIDLYPSDLRAEIDALNDPIYRKLNNGVYRAGFATTQQAYEEAFLFGDRITEADIRLFVTLVRFDAVYHGLFKCNLRRLADYPNLTAYRHRILAIRGVSEMVNIEHIKQGYYCITALNPIGIVPLGP